MEDDGRCRLLNPSEPLGICIAQFWLVEEEKEESVKISE
jgi:hypothetical protein